MAWLLFTVVYLINLSHTVTLGYKRVCYYTNWAQYRNGSAKFEPKNVDPSLCTHLVFAFGELQNSSMTNFEWNDEKRYGEINSLKKNNTNLKTLLALGGWNAGSEPYSDMVSSPDTREIFINSTIAWLRKYDFDGLDVDWEYPANRGGHRKDFQNFPILLQELLEAFEEEAKESNKNRLLLTAAVGVGKSVADTAYNVTEMSKYLDFISLMAYDFRGGWENTTGFNAPLFKSSVDTVDEFNVAYAVEYWLNKGAPKEKLVLGLATYGRSFTLQDPNITGVGAPATGPGPMGSYVSENGSLPYYDICERQINKKGMTYRDEMDKTPYLVDGTFWVGFDDRLSIYNKVTDLVIGRQLGGAMIWALDFDDFNNICGYEAYPISNQINTTLAAAERGVTVPPPSTDIPAATLRPITPNPNLSPITQNPIQRPTNNPIGVGSVGERSCSNIPDGLYQHSLYCSKYIECVGGRTYERDCPEGLKFSITLCRCEWDKTVNCSIKQVKICNNAKRPPMNRSSSYLIFSCQSSFIISCLVFSLFFSNYEYFESIFCCLGGFLLT